MSISPQKRSSSGIVAPVGHMLGNTFLALARSRLPMPNKPRAPKPRVRRAFLVAPIPFAPLVDTHAFQPPPPPYSARPDDVDATTCLPVPHNTPETATPPVVENSILLSASTSSTQPIGLGLEGVERGDGGRFDGLGRLSGGFRAALGGSGTSDALREQVHRMLSEHARRRRTRASEQPTKRHDVFDGSIEAGACGQAMRGGTVKIRIRRKSAASPTPGARKWEGVRRGTISSELKRAASVSRRVSTSEAAPGNTTPWRV